MNKAKNYIATWFYKESDSENSYYPQIGKNGNSALAQSIYMQIQVPFFVTFRHYNPDSEFIFFTNLSKENLPDYLIKLFSELEVSIVTMPYICRPPKGWYSSWQNQFYLYDIFKWAESNLEDEDVMLVCDADCICRSSLKGLFDIARKDGAALYEFVTDKEYRINGITLPEMNILYNDCYGKKPQQEITYYGGELMVFRHDTIVNINKEFPHLWQFNLDYASHSKFRLNEEAHVMSLLAEFLQFRNSHANRYIKRMWTTPEFNNITPDDKDLPIWHLPYEKKRGLYRLYRYFLKNGFQIKDENDYLEKSGKYTGIPNISISKKIIDRIITLYLKFI